MFKRLTHLCWVGAVLMWQQGCSQSTPTVKAPKLLQVSDLPKDCQQIEPVVMRCKPPQSADAVKKMLSVLSEQLSTAPEAEQVKTCRDVLTYWQSACGVTQ